MHDDCLFCKIIAGDIPSDKLYEDDDVYCFRDIAPQAPTHVLIIPKKHLKGPEAVTPEDEKVIGKMIRIGNEIANKEGYKDYRLVFNNGAEAGQTVFHIHMHLLAGRSLEWPPG